MSQPELRYRSAAIAKSAINVEARTVEIALSSETPVKTWDGWEVLDHAAGSVDLSRLQDAGAFLMDHDPCCQVGVFESVSLGEDRVLRGVVRFGRSDEANEAFQDIVDGIKTKISVGFNYDTSMVIPGKAEDGTPLYRLMRWQPMEASLVAIPADPSVGVGRSLFTGAPRSAEPTNPAAPVAATKEVPMEPTTQVAPEAANVEQLRSAAITQERNRASEINTVCAHFGVGERAAEYISSGRSVLEVKEEIFSEFQKRATPVAAKVDMSEKEAKQYSYLRATRAALDMAEGRSVERSFELEVSDDLAKQAPAGYKQRGGVFAPMRLRAGLDSITSTKGTELKYTQYGGEIIELLRNYAATLQMGARQLNGLRSPISFPRQTGAATATWVGENPGSDVADSNVTFGTVTLNPKTLQASTSFSRQLLNLDVVDAEAFVREDLAKVHGLARDLAAIHGTSVSNQPTGIYNTSGVNSVDFGNTVPTFGKWVDMVTEVAKDNALLGTTGYITTPGMAGKMAQTLVASAAGSEMIWTGKYDDGMVAGYKAVATNQVSAVLGAGADHGIVFGNWADLVFGSWGAFELIADPYRLKKQGMIEITSFEMLDLILRHVESFCVATGARLS